MFAASLLGVKGLSLLIKSLVMVAMSLTSGARGEDGSVEDQLDEIQRRYCSCRELADPT